MYLCCNQIGRFRSQDERIHLTYIQLAGFFTISDTDVWYDIHPYSHVKYSQIILFPNNDLEFNCTEGYFVLSWLHNICGVVVLCIDQFEIVYIVYLNIDVKWIEYFNINTSILTGVARAMDSLRHWPGFYSSSTDWKLQFSQ